MQPPTPDYFAVLAAKRRTVTLRLAEGEIEVGRARLRLYAELTDIAGRDTEPEAKAVEYIERAAGRPIDDFDPAFLLETYAKLLDLNKAHSVPAILRVQGKGRTPLAFQYNGRWLVALVEKMVGAGWNPEYVLEEMDPDEVWLYLQEVQYGEWEQYQGAYALSSAGRDAKGRQAKLPPPAWSFAGYDAPRARPAARRRAAGVMGVVLDFTDPLVAAEARKRLSS